MSTKGVGTKAIIYYGRYQATLKEMRCIAHASSRIRLAAIALENGVMLSKSQPPSREVERVAVWVVGVGGVERRILFWCRGLVSLLGMVVLSVVPTRY